MAKSKKKNGSESTLQKIINKQKESSPSKYDYNKVLFQWEANDRPVYSFTRGQKVSFTGLVIFLGLYFFWVGQPILTLVTASIFFILFVFISIPPQRATHNIEKVGVRTLGKLYSWEDMTEFWIAEKDSNMMLYINTRLRFPPRLIFIIENFGDAVNIVKTLMQRKPYRYLVNPQGNMEKMLEGKYIDPIIFLEEEIEKRINELDEAEAKKITKKK